MWRDFCSHSASHLPVPARLSAGVIPVFIFCTFTISDAELTQMKRRIRHLVRCEMAPGGLGV